MVKSDHYPGKLLNNGQYRALLSLEYTPRMANKTLIIDLKRAIIDVDVRKLQEKREMNNGQI